MKYILTILSILFLPIFCLQEIKPKFCINCRYFITDNNNYKYAKCSLFQRKENDIYRLISGMHEDKNNEYQYCSVARDVENMCGLEGKMYKKKYTKKST